MNTEKKPICKLSGTDGNVFAVIGKVIRTLKNANQEDKAEEFKNKAMSSHSYDDVLCLCFDYVDVRGRCETHNCHRNKEQIELMKTGGRVM